MTLEILYFEGCANQEALLVRLRELLRAAGISTDVELVRIEDSDVAERERFLGSPPRCGGRAGYSARDSERYRDAAAGLGRVHAR